MNKIEQILVLLLFLPVLHVMAEDNNNGLTPDMLLPQFANLTPEAASLGRYGAYQVSEYSGTANISIPLYEVKSGDVSFPINLYYDASGIKVEQDATFVGLGWNLSYGGMISHIVCGHDDFQEENEYKNYWLGYWEGTKNLPKDQPCQTFLQISTAMLYDELSIGHVWCPLHEDEYSLYRNMSRGYDSPDVFQANFCGQNISFIIDKRVGESSTGQDSIIILNDNARKYAISYEMERCGSYYCPSSFFITDDKGLTYVFSAYREMAGPYDTADSYYLTKVYGPDGVNGRSTVTFEYSLPTRSYYGKGSRPKSKFHHSKARRIESSDDELPFIDDKFRSQYNHLLESNFTEPVIGCAENGFCNRMFPKKIITALNTIEFYTGTRSDIKDARNISDITIKSNSGSILKTISFSYDYFYEDSPQSDYSGKRLKLTGMTIDDQRYQFEYDDKNLPAFTSYSKDYWGYYNGANPNATCFVGCTPAYTISSGSVKPEEHLEGSNRLASESLCTVGMLKRIKYPTGGYTDYEFESHRFNDKYYYPDASNCDISFPAAYTTHTESLNLYGTMFRTMTVTVGQEDCILETQGQLSGTTDNFTVTVKNSAGTTVRTLYYYGNKCFGETVPLTLTKGATYTIEASLSASASSGVSTLAGCSLKYDVQNPNVSAYPTTNNENGGYSIGGGVRIKTIKNYDSDNTYLSGVEYKYSGGRLLSPTVQLEKHFVDFSYEYTEYNEFMIEGKREREPIYTTTLYPKFSFYYANTEPSYPFICSLGIPATVGYDTVVKNEIDQNGNVLRKTVLDFHNYGYVSDDTPTNQINSGMQNIFYFNSYYNNNPAYAQGHLNGKLKKETRYSDTGKTAYVADYSYSSVRQGSVLYPKCFPTHLVGFEYLEAKYHLGFFRKFIEWSYLTSRSETFYNSSGNVTNSNTTTYTYNEANYQPATKTVNNGLQSEKTRYWYPTDADNPSSGLSILTNKNYLSEVTGIDIYRNNTYTTGSRYHYALSNSMPVVSRCLSIFPDGSTAVEMDVNSYDGYDSSGNIQQYQKKDGTPVTIIWSYKYQLPIMEIVGKTYSQVLSAASNVSQLGSMLSPSYSTIKAVYNNIKQTWPDAHVTAYLYSPWHTVSRVIMPNGQEMTYDYDGEGRLVRAGDLMGTLQEYQYKYKVQ